MTKQENKEATGFVNPFEAATIVVENGVNVIVPGPSIEDFIKAKGEKSVAEYVKGEIKDELNGELREFDKEDITWLEKEILNHNYNKKNNARLLAESQLETNALIMSNTKKIEQ